MSWRNPIYERLVLPLAEPDSYRGLTGRLRVWKERESLPSRRLQEMQWQKVQQLLQHAWQTSPFYRRRMEEAGVHPGQLQNLADLRRIPELTREDIRQHADDMVARNLRKKDLLPSATGGTTDTPVRFWRDRAALREKAAVQWRWNARAGFRPGDRTFYLWGATVDYAENPSWRWRLYDQHLMRRVWAPTSKFNEQVLERYRGMLLRQKPEIIYAYSTPVALLAQYLRDAGTSIPQPRAVICTAEPLLAHQRSLLEEVFACPVIEHYGSREFGMIAGGCGQGDTLHVNPLAALVEYVPVADGGGLCSLVVTDLLNAAMPLIRYRINDCALPPSTDACACGLAYPRFSPIAGRVADVFRLSNGDMIPGVALTNRVLKECPALKKTQIIQEDWDRFRIRFVPGPGFSGDDLALLQRNLRSFFSTPLDWEFEQVQDIERERSGKTRFCISRVQGQPVKRTDTSA